LQLSARGDRRPRRRQAGIGGYEVTFIVRGANLDAIRKNGITLIAMNGEQHVARDVVATDRYDQVGAQDIVVLAMKAHQVEAVAADVPKLFGPETVVVTCKTDPVLVLP